MLAHGERGIERHEDFDLRQVVEEELSAIQPTAQRYGVHAMIAGGPSPVRGDRVLIGRLVANLLRNDVLYNHRGGTVRVHTASAGLSVSNTGPVLEQADVEALFEPFRRGHGRDRRSGTGEGLSLSIVRSIAHAHEGTATAVANPQGGLTVTIKLTAAQDS
ncbi:sensor histidine kinase [Streptomyces sp. NPDC058579]|uniref:sensor histidine kinase n=1 Tax=Streptomyces sp. NPDC058579 TaxID=3346548 RepID=UPI00366334FE